MTDVRRNQRVRSRVSDAARAVVDGAGSGPATVVSLTLVLVWVVIGLMFGFSEDWLALLFACSGAVTFVMVFFIQHVTARDLRAVLLKLDELVAATGITSSLRSTAQPDKQQAPTVNEWSAPAVQRGGMTDFTRNHHVQAREFLLGRGQRANVLTTAEETDGRFDMIDGHKDPGAMTPLHLHRRYEERFWVASGELAVWAGDTHLVLRSGDYYCVPVGVPHTARAGDEGCHALTISSPAGFAELVARAGTPIDVADDAAELDLERFISVGDEVGDVMLGEPGVLPGHLTPEATEAALEEARLREIARTSRAGGTL